MAPSESAGLLTLLRERTELLLERWFAGLAELSVAPLEEDRSSQFWHQLLDWLSDEAASQRQIVAMGAELADLYDGQPAVLGLAQEVLLGQLMEVCKEAHRPALPPRLAVLPGALTEGFASRAGQRALEHLPVEVETALRDSELMFRTLAETTDAAIFMYQSERNIYVNVAAQHITGYSEDELLAMPFWGLIRPDYQNFVRQSGQKRLAGSLVRSHFEIPILTRDGETRWLSYSGKRIILKGRPTVLGTAFDITEQRQIQSARRESELKFRVLAETTAASIVIFQEGKVVYGNRGAEILLGYSADEIIDLNIRKIIPEQQHTVVDQAIADVQAEPSRPVRFAHQIITKQGAERWIDVTLARIEYQGEPAWITTSFDITERVQAEAALRTYSQRLELLSEVDRASLTARPVSEVARQALVLLRELIQCQRAAVVEVDLDAEELVLLAVFPDEEGPLASGKRIPFSQWTDLTDRMAGQALHIADLGLLKSLTPVQEILLARGVHSYFSVPLIAQGTLIGLLNVGAERREAFSQDDRTIVAEVAARLTAAVQNARLFSEVMAGRQRLEELSLRLVQVQETERRYLARELHDEIAQTLTALRINLEMMQEQSQASSSTSLAEATHLVQDLFKRVRDLSLDLRPPMLDDLGLLPTCLWYFDRFTSQYGIPVHLNHRGVHTRFDPEVELVAYRIVQEALTNVARHAHADEVWIHLWVGDDRLNLQIEDRGQGFDAKAVLQRHASSGLSGMVERARLVGGEFSIESERDKGTCLAVVLPLNLPGGDGLEESAFDSRPVG